MCLYLSIYIQNTLKGPHRGPETWQFVKHANYGKLKLAQVIYLLLVIVIQNHVYN